MTQRTQPTLIKRYAGVRFYDTEQGRYVTLEDLADFARDRQPMIIRDAKTGEDITSAVPRATGRSGS